MKDQKELLGLSRVSFINQLKALTEPKPKYDMHGLVEENVFTWLIRNIVNIFVGPYAYHNYPNPAKNNGIFRMRKEPTSVALLADWASNTPESHRIGRMVGHPDYSVHLGDTYYVGNFKEIADNFNDSEGAGWPWGNIGSFALLGNHEMYSSGRSYFKQLLPYMGTVTNGEFQQQEASYFCLENDYWRIIGLDTGYDSITGPLRLPIARFFSNSKLRLPEQHLEWLRNVVKPGSDNRGIIFLSHHQHISAFKKRG